MDGDGAAGRRDGGGIVGDEVRLSKERMTRSSKLESCVKEGKEK